MQNVRANRFLLCVTIFVWISMLAAGQSIQAPAPIFSKVVGGTSGWDVALAAAVDASGNLIFVGTTNSPDFPVTHAFQPRLGIPALAATVDGSSLSYPNLGGAVGVNAIAESQDGQTLYAASPSGTYLSSDGGSTWSLRIPGLAGASAMAVDAGDPNLVYAVATDPFVGGSFYRSADGGQNWTLIKRGGYVGALVTSPSTSRTLYSVVGGLYRSRDGGDSWTTLNPSGGAASISSFALAPSLASRLYAMSADGSLYRSSDDGDSWTKSPAVFASNGIRAYVLTSSIAVDAKNPDTVYVLYALNLYRSTDAGETFSAVTTGSEGNLAGLSMSTHTAGRIAVPDRTGVLISLDGGASWKHVASRARNVFAGGAAFFLEGTCPTSIFVTKLSADGSQVIFSTFLGGTYGEGNPLVAVDATGRIYVAGVTYSPDFPVTGQPTSASSAESTFLARFSSEGNLDFAEVLPGTGGTSGMAVDRDGNTYLNTAGQSGPVVTRVDSTGKVIYSNPLSIAGVTGTYGIAADSTGRAWIVGATDSKGLPVTDSAVQSTFSGGDHDGFIVALSAQGDRLTYLSYIGGNSSTAYGISIDGAGKIYVTGDHCPAAQCDTASLFPKFGFAAKIDSSSPTPIWFAELPRGETGAAIGTDAGGNVWVGGQSRDGDFPTWAPVEVQGTHTGSLMELSADGQKVLFSSFVPGHFALDQKGFVYIAGLTVPEPLKVNADLVIGAVGPTSAFVEKLDPSAVRAAVIDSITTLQQTLETFDTELLGMAPGEMIRINGRGLGPEAAVGAQLDAAGRVASALAGVRVLFDGVPAPLISVQASTIVCMTPFEVAGRLTTNVEIEQDGVKMPGVRVGVKAVSLTPDVLAVANQDGSVNSQSTPAHWGQVVTMYATGLGDTVPSVPDGSLYQAPLPAVIYRYAPSAPIGAVTYVGPAPGQVAGIWQINLRLPAAALDLANPLQFAVGPFGAIASSLKATVWVGQ